MQHNTEIIPKEFIGKSRRHYKIFWESVWKICPWNNYIERYVSVWRICPWKNYIERCVCTSNHIFGRAIWDKLLKCISENLEIAPWQQGQFQNFQKSPGWFITKIRWIKHVNNGWSHQTKKLKLVQFNGGQLQINHRVITKQRVIIKQLR